MHCPKCSASLLPEERFCTNCGTAVACSICGFTISPGARFCGGCGKPLAPVQAVPLPVAALQNVDSAAERRQITVMFCDLVDSTAMSARFDPEDHHEIIRAYQHTCAEIIAEFGGYVAQYLGDGIMVYFGYPKAHEDDPERAVHAGLRITRAVAALRLRPDLRLRTRVGIATGLVVVGDRIAAGTGWEVGVVGETPNLAARLQGLAQPNTVVIGPSTRRLLGSQFDYEDLGAHDLKGFDRPVQAWRVLAERSVANRFRAVRSSLLVPLVDRTEERALLRERSARVLNGEGQIVVLSGEPGIGKSRLARAAVEILCEEYEAWLMEIQCSSFHTQSALFPIIAALRPMIFPDDVPKDPAEGWTGLRAFLREAGFTGDEDVAPLFAHLLDIPVPAGQPPLALTPERHKQFTLNYLLQLIERCAAGQPALLLLEDLHWADPSTLEFVHLFVEQSRARRTFGLFTARPGFNPPWARVPHVTEIFLGRLPSQDAIELVRHMSGLEPLAPEVVETVIAKTDGIPLYLQEYTKTMVELRQSSPGAGKASALIPATLHDLLVARLDRLGEAKLVAQLAAMLGREFSLTLLEAVWNGSRDLLWSGIHQLVEEDVIYFKDEPARERLVFRHALIQDAAYESQLKSNRAYLHRRIAEVIEREFPDTVSREPESLAFHFTTARLPLKAIPYWRQAGTRAMGMAAYAEASRHFETALGLVAELPEDPGRHGLELDLRVRLGMALSGSHGYAAPGVEATYQRARELCGLLGDTADLYPVLRGLVTFYMMRNDLATARELSEHCLRLGSETRRAEYLIEGYNSLGYTLGLLGELEAGADLLEQGIGIYRAEGGESMDFPSLHNPLMGCICFAMLLLWLLGEAERADRHYRELLGFLERCNRPFDTSFAHSFLSFLELLRGHYRQAAEHASKGMDMSERHGYALWLASAKNNFAIAIHRLGDPARAMALLAEGLAEWRACGSENFRPYYLSGFAEACRSAGRGADALAAIQEAIDHAERYHEHWYRAELYRIRGELRAAAEGESPALAEADLRKALAIAREQQARLLELRAALSLYRLSSARERTALEQAAAALAAQGPADIPELREARALLAPVRRSGPAAALSSGEPPSSQIDVQVGLKPDPQPRRP
jgi:class 3 adenylate cyclase/predicted ATPase